MQPLRLIDWCTRRPRRGSDGRPNYQIYSRSPAVASTNSPSLSRGAREAEGRVHRVGSPLAHRRDDHDASDGAPTTTRSTENQSPQTHRIDFTPSSRCGTATQSTVYLGEASSLGWTNTTDNRQRDVASGEGPVQLSYPAPTEQIEDELSPSKLAQNEHKARRLEYLRSIGTFSFPEDAICEEMLAAYFKWFHPCFPILDRPSFYHEYMSKTISPFLLHAIFFVSVVYCETSILHRLGFGDLLEARSSFYYNAKDLYDVDFEEDKTVIVQALFLLSYWRGWPRLEKNARRWLAAAISLAQEQGIYRTWAHSRTETCY